MTEWLNGLWLPLTLLTLTLHGVTVAVIAFTNLIAFSKPQMKRKTIILHPLAAQGVLDWGLWWMGYRIRRLYGTPLHNSLSCCSLRLSAVLVPPPQEEASQMLKNLLNLVMSRIVLLLVCALQRMACNHGCGSRHCYNRLPSGAIRLRSRSAGRLLSFWASLYAESCVRGM